jgi:cysteine synthase A
MSSHTVSSTSEVTRSTRLLAGLLLGALAASSGLYLANQRRRGAQDASSARRKRSKDSGVHRDDSHASVNESSDAGPSAPPKVTIHRPGVVSGVQGLIGNTPLMRIESLSELTGCEILVSRV